MAWLFFFSLLLTLGFSLFTTALLHLQGKAAHAISVYLIAYAEIVLISEIASLLHQINPFFYFLAQTLLLLMAIGMWKKQHTPALMGPWQNTLSFIWYRLHQAKRAPDLLLLGGSIASLYGLLAITSLVYPQNNYDSMTYHLSRVGYWLQNNSLAPWLTPNPRQTSFPINAELGILYSVVFLHSDIFSGMVQWSAWLAGLFAIFGMSRRLGASQRQSLFAGLIWSTFPEIVLQANTTMNDLVASAFTLCSIYLLFLTIPSGSAAKNDDKPSGNYLPYLSLSGLGLALAVGTKSTVVMLLPSLAIAMLLLLIIYRKKIALRLVSWAALGLAAFALVGIFGYAQNVAFYHNPFSVSQWTSDLLNSPTSRLLRLVKSSALYANQLVDLTGLPPEVTQPAAELRVRAVNKLLNYVHTFKTAEWVEWRQQLHSVLGQNGAVHEDTAWFGLVGAVLSLLALALAIVNGIKNRQPLRLFLVLLTLGFFATLAAGVYWTPYHGRYFVLAITLCAPLLAFTYPVQKPLRLWRWGVTLAAIWILLWVVLNNLSRPLVGTGAIWNKTYLNIQMINNPGFQPVIEMVERHAPAGTRLATRLSEDAWDYPLFGVHFERTLLPVDPFDASVNAQTLLRLRADYLLIDPRQRTFLAAPADLHLVDQVNGWLLYSPCPQADCSPTPTDSQFTDGLTGASDPGNLMTIHPELLGKVGILELKSAAWGIEQVDGRGIVWLGEGDLQGLRGYLWSIESLAVNLLVEVEPGPSNWLPGRNVIFKYYARNSFEYKAEGQRLEAYPFSQPGRLKIHFLLQPGLNEFRLSSGDLANVFRLPNNDPRSILILIKSIQLDPADK